MKEKIDKRRSSSGKLEKERTDKKGDKSEKTHFLVKVLAVVLLIAGVIMALPLVPGPGLLMIALALILLGEESPLGQRIISILPAKVRDEIRKRRRGKNK